MEQKLVPGLMQTNMPNKVVCALTAIPHSTHSMHKMQNVERGQQRSTKNIFSRLTSTRKKETTAAPRHTQLCFPSGSSRTYIESRYIHRVYAIKL